MFIFLWTPADISASSCSLFNTELLLCSWAEAEPGPGLMRDTGRQHAHTLQKLLYPLPETQHFFIFKVNLWLPWFPGSTGLTLLWGSSNSTRGERLPIPVMGLICFPGQRCHLGQLQLQGCRELGPLAQTSQHLLGYRDFSKITLTPCCCNTRVQTRSFTPSEKYDNLI